MDCAGTSYQLKCDLDTGEDILFYYGMIVRYMSRMSRTCRAAPDCPGCIDSIKQIAATTCIHSQI